MTKVNYFRVPGQDSTGAKEEMVVYARSKKEASGIATIHGIQNINPLEIKELNFKTEVTKLLDLKEMYEIRLKDKSLWKEVSKKEE